MSLRKAVLLWIAEAMSAGDIDHVSDGSRKISSCTIPRLAAFGLAIVVREICCGRLRNMCPAPGSTPSTW